MWKTVKPVLASLFSSKKFLALLAGLLVWVVGKAGLELSDSDVMPMLLLIGSYIGAQGIADFRKEEAKVIADALAKKPVPDQLQAE